MGSCVSSLMRQIESCCFQQLVAKTTSTLLLLFNVLIMLGVF